MLRQFMQDLRQAHWDTVLRLLRYLKSCPGQGILLSPSSHLDLYVYCDSDWASCPMTRKLVTGYFIKLGTSPISWKTKKQNTVSRLSAEAEYQAMANATSEVIWIRNLLKFLGLLVSPAVVHCDNPAAIHIAANLVFHKCTKHIEVDCHFVREKIASGDIVTCYTPSTEQLADIFTKALGQRHF